MNETRTTLKAKDWKLALQRAFDGERSAALEHLGGLDEVVRVDIANSADAAESTVELYEALDDIIASWRWRPSAHLDATAMMLDLIRAFQPRRGGPKTVNLLQSWQSGTSLLEVVPDKFVDVRLLALKVLEKYYPTPMDNSREWDSYVAVLYKLLANSEQPLYILMRLLAIDASDCHARVASMIATNEHLLPILVSKLLESDAQTAPDDALSLLYSACIPDRVTEFEQAVSNAGGMVKKTGEAPVITTASNTFPVEPTDKEILEAMQTASNQFKIRLDIAIPFTGILGDGNGSAPEGQ